MAMSDEELEKLAGYIGGVAYNAYCVTLIGTSIPPVTELYERCSDVRVGDLVVEVTTLFMRSRSTLDAVGILLRIAREPVNFGPDAEPWDEATEGQPHPTETIYYIRTLDGREFRWNNARFISAPTEYPLRPPPPPPQGQTKEPE